MMTKPSILFLCTGNSCRSQMAESLCRHHKSNFYEVYSAGLETHGLNPRAVKVMAEIGIDISQHKSKTLEDLKQIEPDEVVTVCEHASQTCPTFNSTTNVRHVGSDDPPALAKNAQTEEQALASFRRVRDEINEFIQRLPQALDTIALHEH